jgi:hypothetical protein
VLSVALQVEELRGQRIVENDARAEQRGLLHRGDSCPERVLNALGVGDADLYGRADGILVRFVAQWLDVVGRQHEFCR